SATRLEAVGPTDSLSRLWLWPWGSLLQSWDVNSGGASSNDHAGFSYPIRSSPSPTWKRYLAPACQVGTGGLSRLGQLASSMPQGLPSISPGKASPGLTTN